MSEQSKLKVKVNKKVRARVGSKKNESKANHFQIGI